MIVRTASEALPVLCSDVLAGQQLGSRNGAVKEQLFYHVGLTEPWRREILTPGRKANVVAQIAETLWVLAGRNDVEWLSAYLPRAADFSDDGKTWRAGYGPRLRGWADEVDQIAEVVARLQADLDDRRAVMSLWDPELDNVGGKDIPCNNWLHFLVRDGYLHLHVATRSNDLMWGWSGINAFEWSALQELVASMVGAEVGELHFAVTSMHLYQPYWAKAERLATAIHAEGQYNDSPRAAVKSVAELDEQLAKVFAVEGQLRNGATGPFLAEGLDPMLQSWLSVLVWHWTKNETAIAWLKGTRLYAATREMPVTKPSVAEEFAGWAAKLHAEKHAIYGDSWKKRGEQVSIQANIARKIDRLGKAGAGDTELDTTTDLLVYLVKYVLWLEERDTDGQEHVEDVCRELVQLAGSTRSLADPKSCEVSLTAQFDGLLEGAITSKYTHVSEMAVDAFALALHWYTQEQKARGVRDAALRQAPEALMSTAHARRNAIRRWNPEAPGTLDGALS